MMKSENGTDDKNRKVMNFALNQRHHDMLRRPDERYNHDCKARIAAKNLKARQQVSIVGHLLGDTPDEWEHEHVLSEAG
jgi:hypothetical protein